MLQARQREGVATEVSQTAGAFDSNHVFYALMHAPATPHDMALTAGAIS